VKIGSSVSGARRWTSTHADRPLVLVPTMGALHPGHAALLRKGRELAGSKGTLAASIFVNPIQFGEGEDFDSYPRPLKEDEKICRASGVDFLFRPPIGQMVPGDRSVTVEEGALSLGLCGGSRPGHFTGVCTIVAKLFHILGPDIAVFGEKDWQQLAVIRRMVRDLDFPVRIVGFPTVRESDGLAVSSRNAYLTPGQRAEAPGIYGALESAAGLPTRGEILRHAKKRIAAIPGARIDYVELVDAATLQPILRVDRSARLLAAVFLGKARLIDNIGVSPRK